MDGRKNCNVCGEESPSQGESPSPDERRQYVEIEQRRQQRRQQMQQGESGAMAQGPRRSSALSALTELTQEDRMSIPLFQRVDQERQRLSQGRVPLPAPTSSPQQPRASLQSAPACQRGQCRGPPPAPPLRTEQPRPSLQSESAGQPSQCRQCGDEGPSEEELRQIQELERRRQQRRRQMQQGEVPLPAPTSSPQKPRASLQSSPDGRQSLTLSGSVGENARRSSVLTQEDRMSIPIFQRVDQERQRLAQGKQCGGDECPSREELGQSQEELRQSQKLEQRRQQRLQQMQQGESGAVGEDQRRPSAFSELLQEDRLSIPIFQRVDQERQRLAQRRVPPPAPTSSPQQPRPTSPPAPDGRASLNQQCCDVDEEPSPEERRQSLEIEQRRQQRRQQMQQCQSGAAAPELTQEERNQIPLFRRVDEERQRLAQRRVPPPAPTSSPQQPRPTSQPASDGRASLTQQCCDAAEEPSPEERRQSLEMDQRRQQRRQQIRPCQPGAGAPELTQEERNQIPLFRRVDEERQRLAQRRVPPPAPPVSPQQPRPTSQLAPAGRPSLTQQCCGADEEPSPEERRQSLEMDQRRQQRRQQMRQCQPGATGGDPSFPEAVSQEELQQLPIFQRMRRLRESMAQGRQTASQPCPPPQPPRPTHAPPQQCPPQLPPCPTQAAPQQCPPQLPPCPTQRVPEPCPPPCPMEECRGAMAVNPLCQPGELGPMGMELVEKMQQERRQQGMPYMLQPGMEEGMQQNPVLQRLRGLRQQMTQSRQRLAPAATASGPLEQQPMFQQIHGELNKLRQFRDRIAASQAEGDDCPRAGPSRRSFSEACLPTQPSPEYTASPEYATPPSHERARRPPRGRRVRRVGERGSRSMSPVARPTQGYQPRRLFPPSPGTPPPQSGPIPFWPPQGDVVDLGPKRGPTGPMEPRCLFDEEEDVEVTPLQTPSSQCSPTWSPQGDTVDVGPRMDSPEFQRQCDQLLNWLGGIFTDAWSIGGRSSPQSPPSVPDTDPEDFYYPSSDMGASFSSGMTRSPSPVQSSPRSPQGGQVLPGGPPPGDSPESWSPDYGMSSPEYTPSDLSPASLPEEPVETNMVLPNMESFLLVIDYTVNGFLEDRSMRLKELELQVACMQSQCGDELEDSVFTLISMIRRRGRMLAELEEFFGRMEEIVMQNIQCATDRYDPRPNLNNLHLICHKPVDPSITQQLYVKLLDLFRGIMRMMREWCAREVPINEVLLRRVGDLLHSPEFMPDIVRFCNETFADNHQSIAKSRGLVQDVLCYFDRFICKWRNLDCPQLNRPLPDDMFTRFPKFPDLTAPELEAGIAPGQPMPQPRVPPPSWPTLQASSSAFQPDPYLPGPSGVQFNRPLRTPSTGSSGYPSSPRPPMYPKTPSPQRSSPWSPQITPDPEDLYSPEGESPGSFFPPGCGPVPARPVCPPQRSSQSPCDLPVEDSRVGLLVASFDEIETNAFHELQFVTDEREELNRSMQALRRSTDPQSAS